MERKKQGSKVPEMNNGEVQVQNWGSGKRHGKKLTSRISIEHKRDREKNSKHKEQLFLKTMICVCVCVRERERARERQTEREIWRDGKC